MLINKTHCLNICMLLLIVLIIPGCGKHEEASSIMGTATGAAIGASVAGKHRRGTGALLGGLIGNVFGGSVGRAADAEEQKDAIERRERQHARDRAIAQRELEQVKRENRILKQKWCSACNRQVTLNGAKSCPSCGGELIHERYCRECTASFKPHSGFRYCPYCKHGTKLCAR